MNRRQSFAVIAGLLIVAAFTRLIPHYPNFTSLGAVALLGGAWFRNKAWAVLIPLSALFLSDLVLNNAVYAYSDDFVFTYSGMAYVYGAFALVSLIGMLGLKGNARTSNWKGYTLYAIVSTVAFFVISNFGSWLADPMYTKDLQGLVLCYEMALPYAVNSLAGTMVFGFALMFAKEGILGREAKMA